jgi:hypothetical protein
MLFRQPGPPQYLHVTRRTRYTKFQPHSGRHPRTRSSTLVLSVSYLLSKELAAALPEVSDNDIELLAEKLRYRDFRYYEIYVRRSTKRTSRPPGLPPNNSRPETTDLVLVWGGKH